MLETELKFFIDHQAELVKKYLGKTLTIRGNEVVDVHTSPLQAYLAAMKKFDAGTYLIQRCEPGSGAYTVTLAHV